MFMAITDWLLATEAPLCPILTKEVRNPPKKPVSVMKLPPSFKCDTCGDFFSTDFKLKTHAKTHESPIACRICGKVQPDRSKLERHMLVHTQVKNFMCTYCDRTFTHDCNRKTHERLHTGEKPFKCILCSFSAAQTANMQYHMKSKHKFVHTDLVNLKFDTEGNVCEVCGKSFSCKAILKMHSQQHPPLDARTCPVCKASFKFKHTLEKHVTMHYTRKIAENLKDETTDIQLDNLKGGRVSIRKWECLDY